jgi:hypothetical protein
MAARRYRLSAARRAASLRRIKPQPRRPPDRSPSRPVDFPRTSSGVPPVNIEPFPIPTPDDERFPGDSDGAIKSELRAPAKIMAIHSRPGFREGTGVRLVASSPPLPGIPSCRCTERARGGDARPCSPSSTAAWTTGSPAPTKTRPRKARHLTHGILAAPTRHALAASVPVCERGQRRTGCASLARSGARAGRVSPSRRAALEPAPPVEPSRKSPRAPDRSACGPVAPAARGSDVARAQPEKLASGPAAGGGSGFRGETRGLRPAPLQASTGRPRQRYLQGSERSGRRHN